MILEMEKLTLVGLAEDEESVLKALMKKRCLQLRSPESLEQYEEIRALAAPAPAQTYELERQVSRFSQMIKFLSAYLPKESIFAKKPRLTFDDLQSRERYQNALEICGDLEKVSERISERRTQRNSSEFTLKSLEPWRSLDLPLGQIRTKSCQWAFYVFSASVDEEELAARLTKEAPASYMQLVSADEEQKYIAFLYYRDEAPQVMEVLRSCNTTAAPLDQLDGTVAENIKRLEREIAELDEADEADRADLAKRKEDMAAIRYGFDAASALLEQQRARSNSFATRSTFALAGWVPKYAEQDVANLLEQYGCFYQFSPPEKDEEAPLLLKNSRLVKPFEIITNLYGPPSYLSLDSNVFVAFFFWLFFGMMLADVGYGLILFAAGLLARKLMDLSDSMKNISRLVQYAGLSAIIWGVVFGGYFGDAVNVVARTFFHSDFTMPVLINPLEDPVSILILAMALGVVHIFLGMGLSAYLMIRRGHLLDAIFDIGFWYCLLIGLPMMLLSGVPGKIGMALAIGGAAGLILTQGRAQKNVFMKAVKGVGSLYNTVSYFSDVLSYSRILALCMSGSVIAQVVNMMGSLPGGNLIGAIVFLIVFCVGNALNFAISVLGAYVHSSRLQYIEFFGKFYESGGQPFTPLQAKAKYNFIINEEEM